MTTEERDKTEKDYELCLWLLDYYAKNREAAKSMTDREYLEHIDAILDEINRLKKLLAEDEKAQSN